MSPMFVVSDGHLVEMVEQPFNREGDLQEHLAAHPELLAGEVGPADRRSWLLIEREMGVAETTDGPNRWSLDHLFVDEDGVPTLVEVKRSSDTRLRREVVGQMLDYAANAAAHWSAATLRSTFERRLGSEHAATERLRAFVSGAVDVDSFWDLVAANLAERRLRLVFLADDIPPELRSIIEFLNEQLVNTEVVGVEVKQYSGPHGQLNIVPRIIGETETARRTKTTAAPRRARTAGSEQAFVADTRAAYEPALAERVISLFRYARPRNQTDLRRAHQRLDG